MTCIKDLVDSKLFRMPQCREILLPEFCREIKEKLESKEEVSSSCLLQHLCVVNSTLIILNNNSSHLLIFSMSVCLACVLSVCHVVFSGLNISRMLSCLVLCLVMCSFWLHFRSSLAFCCWRKPNSYYPPSTTLCFVLCFMGGEGTVWFVCATHPPTTTAAAEATSQHFPLASHLVHVHV